MFNKLPDDPFITEIDSVQRCWMFYNWLGDQKDMSELAKNHAYLLASFYDSEAVRKALGEGSDVHESTDEEFEESTRMIRELNATTNEVKNEPIRRKRRKLKD
jgi:hypothetical protein